MNRSNLKTVSLLVTSLCFLGATICYYQSNTKLAEVNVLQGEKMRLEDELRNVNRLSLQLDDLDTRTLDERVATQLDILRHLGLAQMDLSFRIDGRETRTIAGTSVYVRGTTIENVMPYSAALKLLDMLQANRKMVINGVEVTAGNTQIPDSVTLRVNGQIFGLDKRGEL